MCKKLDAEAIVISCFNISKEPDLYFKTLNEIRSQIEKDDNDVYVDVTYSSIRKTVMKFHESLEIDDLKLHLINPSFTKNFLHVSIDKKYEKIIKETLTSVV
jgi:hypothetical protein